MHKIKTFNIAALTDLLFVAKSNHRKRKYLNLHQSYDEKCQKIINAIGLNSYIAPHRHSLDPKSETLIALSGSFAFISFDDEGLINEVIKFRAQSSSYESISCYGLDIPHEIWHTVISMEPNSILLEIKEGPFILDFAKEIAPWAPDEKSENAVDYFNSLRELLGIYPLDWRSI